MMAVAVTGSIGDLSHSRITTAEWHVWHIMRRSDGSRAGSAMHAVFSDVGEVAKFSVVGEVAKVAATGDGAVR